MTRLLIWRHGQTAWNLQNRIQGQRDTDLDETGWAQVETAAAALADEHVDLLVTSDLRRARQTAETYAALTRLPVLLDPRLRERKYGDWEGLTHAQIAARWPTEFERWKVGEPVPECGLEDSQEVAKRVAEAIVEVAAKVGEGTAVLVSHGGAARQGMGPVLGWPTEVVRALAPLANCHWSELRRDVVGWRLHSHNVGPRAVPEVGGAPDDPPGAAVGQDRLGQRAASRPGDRGRETAGAGMAGSAGTLTSSDPSYLT